MHLHLNSEMLAKFTLVLLASTIILYDYYHFDLVIIQSVVPDSCWEKTLTEPFDLRDIILWTPHTHILRSFQTLNTLCYNPLCVAKRQAR